MAKNGVKRESAFRVAFSAPLSLASGRLNQNDFMDATNLSRRAFLARTATVGAGIAAVNSVNQSAQEFLPGQPTRYPDPRIVVLEKRFAKYKVGNTVIQRLYHDPTMFWAEGC